MAKPRRNWSKKIKELAKQRLENGESLSSVARDLGVAKSTLHGWSKGIEGYMVCRECKQKKRSDEF